MIVRAPTVESRQEKIIGERAGNRALRADQTENPLAQSLTLPPMGTVQLLTQRPAGVEPVATVSCAIFRCCLQR